MEDFRRLLHRGNGETALFLNHHGQRLTRQGFWLIIKGYAKAAGVENITPHTLPHSSALDMLGRGMQLPSAHALLTPSHTPPPPLHKPHRPLPPATPPSPPCP